MGRTWLEDLALKPFPAEKRMIPGTGPDVMLRLKVPSALKRTIGTAGLLAVLIISALSLSAASATSAVSFRAGLQPEGARLVIDLDRPVKYSLSAEGSKVIIDIRAESAEERSGNFPNNRVASSFSARPTAGGTSLEINHTHDLHKVLKGIDNCDSLGPFRHAPDWSEESTHQDKDYKKEKDKKHGLLNAT